MFKAILLLLALGFPCVTGVEKISEWKVLNDTERLVLFHWNASARSRRLLNHFDELEILRNVYGWKCQFAYVDPLNNPELTAIFNVDAYPHIKYFANGSIFNYKSSASLEHLIRFVNVTEMSWSDMDNITRTWKNSWHSKIFPEMAEDPLMVIDVELYHLILRAYEIIFLDVIWTGALSAFLGISVALVVMKRVL
jgi:hypothetical protein